MTQQNFSSSSSFPTSVSIDLALQTQSNVPAVGGKGFRMRIDASQAAGIRDDAVFLYYQGALNPSTGLVSSCFAGVCTWPDLENYDQAEPTAGSSPKYFRLPYVDVVVDDENVADSAWQLISSDVQALLDSIAAGAAMQTVSTITLGGGSSN